MVQRGGGGEGLAGPLPRGVFGYWRHWGHFKLSWPVQPCRRMGEGGDRGTQGREGKGVVSSNNMFVCATSAQWWGHADGPWPHCPQPLVVVGE
jgi:hypothetical protein